MGFDGGKMLTRIALADPATPWRAGELREGGQRSAELKLIAMLASSTLPAVLLGGEVKDADAALTAWQKALALPTVETDLLLGPNPPGSAWWDVPVSETS
jgi:thiamine pyrophosphate-dependent acetolactate synthase large subunit-like protein